MIVRKAQTQKSLPKIGRLLHNLFYLLSIAQDDHFFVSLRVGILFAPKLISHNQVFAASRVFIKTFARLSTQVTGSYHIYQ